MHTGAYGRDSCVTPSQVPSQPSLSSPQPHAGQNHIVTLLPLAPAVSACQDCAVNVTLRAGFGI